MEKRLTPDNQQPRPEPEIYPPGAIIPRDRIRISTGAQDTQQIYIARLGPFGRVLLALAIGSVAVLALFVLLGAAMILAAVAAVLVAGAIISAAFRGRFMRLR
jgi:hypothetical protein